MTLDEIRAKRASALKRAEALTENDQLNDEQQADFDAAMAEVGECDAQAKALEESAKAAAARREAVAKAASTGRRSTSDITVGNRRVLDDPKRGFSCVGDFAMEVYNAGPSLSGVLGNPRLMAAAGDGMQQGVSADGGVLVPPAFSREIWDGARAQSNSLLQYLDTIPVDAGAESVTFPASDETSRVNGSRWGGIQGDWKGELTQMSASKPKLREVTLRPNEVYVFAYVSDKLLRSAPQAASSYITTAAADEINFKIGDAVFNGDGAGKPLGFIGHNSVVSVAKESGQAAATITAPNIWKMYAACHANWRSGAAWFINQEAEVQLQQLTLSVGTGGVPLYVPPGGIADAPNARLLGLPVVVVEYAAALGTVGDITLANLKSYAMGVRGMVDSSQSMHLKFDYAQTAFRWIYEADGQPWMRSAITPVSSLALCRRAACWTTVSFLRVMFVLHRSLFIVGLAFVEPHLRFQGGDPVCCLGQHLCHVGPVQSRAACKVSEFIKAGFDVSHGWLLSARGRTISVPLIPQRPSCDCRQPCG